MQEHSASASSLTDDEQYEQEERELRAERLRELRDEIATLLGDISAEASAAAYDVENDEWGAVFVAVDGVDTCACRLSERVIEARGLLAEQEDDEVGDDGAA